MWSSRPAYRRWPWEKSVKSNNSKAFCSPSHLSQKSSMLDKWLHLHSQWSEALHRRGIICIEQLWSGSCTEPTLWKYCHWIWLIYSIELFKLILDVWGPYQPEFIKGKGMQAHLAKNLKLNKNLPLEHKAIKIITFSFHFCHVFMRKHFQQKKLPAQNNFF